MNIIKNLLPISVLNIMRMPYHWFLSKLAAFWYENPSAYINIVGVTGTKGKTTVAHLITKILEEARYKTAMLSSLEFKIGDDISRNEFKMTMPGRFFIQKFLKKATENHCQYAVIEVTSEGIKQFRHQNIEWDSAVLTNLAPEHIESHGSFENYRIAKEKLFGLISKTHRKPEISKNIIVNFDDENAEHFLKYKADKIYGYKLKIPNSPARQDPAPRDKFQIQNSNFKTIEVENVQLTKEGIDFEIDKQEFHSPLPGEFNLYNILAAVAFAFSQNIEIDEIKIALEKFNGISGRMEFVQREPFNVIVDYAHTPDSLREVYKFIKTHLAPKKLICVLGSAGGGRDKWKRPEMGRIAVEYCDEIILTNEDPYDENPASILNNIEAGFSQTKNYKLKTKNFFKILDRQEAIKTAIESANAGDCLIITGKGAEPWLMGPNGAKIPWDDREIVRKVLKNQV